MPPTTSNRSGPRPNRPAPGGPITNGTIPNLLRSSRGPIEQTQLKNTSLARNVLWLYALQGLNYTAPLILLPYLVRVLGAERYGLLVLSQSVAQYFVIATDYGFNFSATRSIATNRHDGMAISRIFWTVISIKAVLVLIGAIAISTLATSVPRFRPDCSIYLAAYLSVVGSALFPQWLFQGMESMRSISIISGLAKIGACILVLLFVHRPEDTIRAALLMSGGQLASGMVGAAVGVRRYIGWITIPDWAGLLTTLRNGGHLFLTTASISVFTNTNTLLVGLIAGNAQAGYFSLADKLIRATTGSLIGPVLQAAYPHTIRLISQSKRDALRFLRRVVGYGGSAAMLAGAAIFLLAGPIARAAFGGDAPRVVLLIECSAMFPLLATMNGVLGNLVLIPFGCDRPQSQLLLGATVLNAALGSILILAAGAIGGVITMIVVELALVAGNLLILLRRRINLLQGQA